MKLAWITLLFGILTVLDVCWANNRRVVCYYTNWSAYRPGLAKFLPQNINPYLCTHLIYAFGGFTNEFMLKPFDKWQDVDQGGYAKFNGLKAHNKNLKTLLAIGGWNEGSTRFSKLVADPETRQNFVKSALKYLRQHNFDGLDLDWEYPGSRDGSKSADRQNYALLVKELREAFNNEKTGNRDKLLLTMAVPAGVETIEKGYDIKSLNRDLDFFNILSYDYHSSFEPQVNHHAPLRALSDRSLFDPNEELNIEATLQIYTKNGASPNKLVMGIPTYGRAYKLSSPTATDLGSPAEGPAEAGKATREKGYLAYYEICEKIGVDGWQVEKPDPDALGPYAYKDDEWVGYDDEEMVARKAEYVIENGLGGIMFWSIDNDDFRGRCTGQQYPLIEAGKAALLAKDKPSKTPSKSRPSSSNSNLRRPISGKITTTTSRTTTRKTVTSFTTPEPPTTPDTAVDFVCTEEGFYPNPRDCKKYFWCLDSGSVGIVSHVFTCPSSLLFNKFTDSCDYPTNVLCKTGTTTTTTVKPFLAQSTTLATRPTTTTTTAAPEPEYEDEEQSEDVEEDVQDKDLSSPEELQQLLQLIEDLGGVDAVKQLLERNANRGRGRQEAGRDIQLTLAQRKALERVIRPVETTTRSRPGFRNRPAGSQFEGENKSRNTPKYVTLTRQRTSTPTAEEQIEEVEEEETVDLEPTTTVRPNRRPQVQYSTLQRQKPAVDSNQQKDEVPVTTTTTTVKPISRPVDELPDSTAQGAEISGTDRGTTKSTVDETRTVSGKEDSSATDSFELEVETDDGQAKIFSEELLEEEDIFDDSEIPSTTTTTTTTTTATTTTTTPTPKIVVTRRKFIPRTTTEKAESAETQSEVTNSPPVQIRRPFRPKSRLSSSGSSAETKTDNPPVTVRSTTLRTTTRAAIKIAIPASVVKPTNDEFFKTDNLDEQDHLLTRGASDSDHDDSSHASVLSSPNGNVVEIDEDGRVFCYDTGNFAYPDDCKRFIRCARLESGGLRGWIYTCPRNLSFDPVGAICNWGSPLRCRKL